MRMQAAFSTTVQSVPPNAPSHLDLVFAHKSMYTESVVIIRPERRFKRTSLRHTIELDKIRNPRRKEPGRCRGAVLVKQLTLSQPRKKIGPSNQPIRPLLRGIHKKLACKPLGLSSGKRPLANGLKREVGAMGIGFLDGLGLKPPVQEHFCREREQEIAQCVVQKWAEHPRNFIVDRIRG